MTRVTKVLGCAGSGKSWTTRQRLSKLITNGILADETAIVSYTTSAVADVLEGLKEAAEENDELPESFVSDGDIGDYGITVSTINALCLRTAVINGFEHHELISLMDKGDEEVFCEFFAEEMPRYSFETPREEDFEFSTAGAKMVAAYNDVRARGARDVEDVAHLCQKLDLGCPYPDFLQFVALWTMWKRETGNRQHNDYIAHVRKHKLIPRRSVQTEEESDRIRVLVIDEFQDLSPLQNDVYEMWRDSEEFEQIIIAGDAAQSIYGFLGGDPVYLVETPAEEVVELSASRRCAPEVIEYGDKLIAGEGYFTERLTSTRDGDFRGFVDDNYHVDNMDDVTQLVKSHTRRFGSTFLLARRNKDVTKLARTLNEAGIPHTSVSPAAADKYEGLWYWDDPLPDLRLLFHNWRNGCSLSPLWVEAFLKNTTLENEYTYRVGVGIRTLLEEDDDSPKLVNGEMCPPEVMDYVTGGLSVGEAILTLDLDEKRVDALENALRAGINVGPETVKIGTLHSAKGLEAEACILLGSVSASRYEMLKNTPDALAEEKRLYHVGVTRAQDSVFIVSGVCGSKRSPALP